LASSKPRHSLTASETFPEPPEPSKATSNSSGTGVRSWGGGGLELSDASIKSEIEHQQYKITKKREIALWEDDKNSRFAGVSSEVRGILDEKLVNSILELSFFF
jgi:hypothetical protein